MLRGLSFTNIKTLQKAFTWTWVSCDYSFDYVWTGCVYICVYRSNRIVEEVTIVIQHSIPTRNSCLCQSIASFRATSHRVLRVIRNCSGYALWLVKTLVSPMYPTRCTTKSNSNLVTCAFPRFRAFSASHVYCTTSLISPDYLTYGVITRGVKPRIFTWTKGWHTRGD